MSIGRVVFRGKPAMRHPHLMEWETADIVVFVMAGSRVEAVRKAKDKLTSEHWEPLEIQLCDRLVDELVRSEGGDFLALYEEAIRSGAAIKIFPRQWPRSAGGHLPILPIQTSEAFVDRVVERAGGVRLTEDGIRRMADYRIGNWIFELKELKDEGLLHGSRQQKIRHLLETSLDDHNVLRLDPKTLDPGSQQRLRDIMGTPIQKQVKSASKQIRSTINILGEDGLRGGLIYINTGYSSIDMDDFGPMVERYVTKDTSQIEALLCISVVSATNGFDTQVMYRVHPVPGDNVVIESLRSAFEIEFEDMISSVLRGEKPTNAERCQKPLAPVFFASQDNMIVWDPGEVEASWRD
jgi:hypothetical protein